MVDKILEVIKKNQAVQAFLFSFVVTGVVSAGTHTIEMYRAWVVTKTEVGKSISALEQSKLWELNAFCDEDFKYTRKGETKIGTKICGSGDVLVSHTKDGGNPKFKWVSWRKLNTNFTFISEAQAGGIQYEQSPTTQQRTMRMEYNQNGRCEILWIDTYTGTTVESQPCVSEMVNDGG